MKTLFTLGALLLAINCSSVWAQYIGPNGSPTSVRQLLEYGRDHDFVVLQGNIIGRTVYNDLYELNDGTGTISIKIDHERWPLNLQVDDKTRVEISGKFDRDLVGFNKVKVMNIRAIE